MNRNFDLSIAGAGVMGLACALEAARKGEKVGVFDPSGGGSKASFAAAGILVTRDAHAFASPFREFYVRSIRQYPEWLAGVSAASGVDIPLHRKGDNLIFDMNDSEAVARLDAKRRQFDREKAADFTETDRLPDFLRPHCPLDKVKVFNFPGEAYVQNRDLMTALRIACERAGVVFLTAGADPGSSWTHAGGTTRLDFTKAAGETWESRRVLIAAGAWTAQLLEGLGITAPLVGVKGQMIRIPRFHASESMAHFNDDLYLVPRGDSLVVGATTEPGVWDERFDATGEAFIESRLARMLPGISRSSLERWAGIRPRPKDRLPWMGWVDAERGLAICTGHYKCGISMAPLAAQCMTRLMHGEKPPMDLAAFNPWRRQGLSRI
ncbi:MAG: FAD-dependent oxidoreductase [Fibrobacteria bacterium]